MPVVAFPPLVLVLVLGVATPSPAAGEETGGDFPRIEHEIIAELDPKAGTIAVSDRLTLPASDVAGTFLLHGDLKLDEATFASGVERVREVPSDEQDPWGAGEMGAEVPLVEYRFPAPRVEAAVRSIHLRYRGRLHHALAAEPEEYARSFSRTPGIITEAGAFLSGSSFWIPHVAGTHVTFRLSVILPADWDAVSQGDCTGRETTSDNRLRVTWQETHPMEEVYLIAGPLSHWEQSRDSGPEARVYLRTPDAALAARYLDATHRYVAMYSDLIGPYPYRKFALVENFWETGYGMPSFTLLGPQVIRLPFILNTSYPHEILHNWWGNSVYVDYATGNWCEGLTSYLADHLMAEVDGRGPAYRRDVLAKYYHHYRTTGDAIPLRDFRSRHSAASEAVGYGKSLMLWHMLRRDLGDEQFVRALRLLYERRRFHRTSFGDIERIFSEAAGRDLAPFFSQWVERSGAPHIAIRSIRCDGTAEGGAHLLLEVAQDEIEGEPFYRLRVPVAVGLRGEAERRLFQVELTGATATLDVALPVMPSSVQLDPRFDLFRRVDAAEVPATLEQLFSDERAIFVLPDDMADGCDWMAFVRAWQERAGGASDDRIRRAGELESLPTDSAVWVLGAGNPWAVEVLARLGAHDVTMEAGVLSVGRERFDLEGRSFVLVTRAADDSPHALAWIESQVPGALAGLARKVPHYGRYSWLVFRGETPDNVGKGQWPAPAVPLGIAPGALTSDERRAEGALTSHAPLPAEPPPLARPPVPYDRARLLAHVRFCADDALEGRGSGTPGAERAAEYIAAEFERAGLKPAGDVDPRTGKPGWFASWEEAGGPGGAPVTLRNVVGVLRGRKKEWHASSVLLGAHYDHLGRGWPDVHAGDEGVIHNGADDNASGIAVLIEAAARLAREVVPERTIIFVAFGGEEWGLRGSRRYVAAPPAEWPASDVFAMLNLDCVGRLGKGKLVMLGAATADEWAPMARFAGYSAGVEVDVVAADPGGSDQVSFQNAGIPAIQLWTGPHEDYHRPTDDVERIDVDGIGKTLIFVCDSLGYLAARDRPLTLRGVPIGAASAGAGADRTAGAEGSSGSGEGAGAGTPRRVSLGTIPDFGYTGPGVRIDGVRAESPAAVAGLLTGDVITAIDQVAIENLRALSEFLKTRRAGERVTVHIRRGTDALTVDAILEER